MLVVAVIDGWDNLLIRNHVFAIDNKVRLMTADHAHRKIRKSALYLAASKMTLATSFGADIIDA